LDGIVPSINLSSSNLHPIASMPCAALGALRGHHGTMKSHVQALVIGGGVVGCSVLFHLTKLGWTDVVLCEREELTAGSSWHAAGGFHALNSDANVAKLQAYTVRLYRELESLSGQDIGLHFTGGLNVAATKERWELLRADWARHRVLGLDTRLVGPREIAELCPLIDATSVMGAVFDPLEGHLDPSGATHAFAKAARLNGAEIYRHTRVVELKHTAGGWLVVTDRGTIVAEHVVNAGGLWAREVGLMAGVDLPVVAMEHHYLLTENLPELENAEAEMPLVLDLDGEIYLRQEQRGVLLGVYEKEATPWAVEGTPWAYGPTELLPPALDRLTDALEKGFRRFPALSNAGIRKVVNGPFTFSPDGNPLVGPVPGLKNYWSACGVMAGFAQGGGVGLALSQWMIEGEPEGDVFAMDVARFGPYATRPYAIERAREFYARRFQIAYPNETLPAGRPSKTSAVHRELAQANAVFGVSYGEEVPLFFAREGAVEPPALRRSSAFALVKEECRAARDSMGLLDISCFGKYRVTGSGAARALDRLLAGRLPDIGSIRLTPMLSLSGRLMGDLTALRLAQDEFYLLGSGYLQSWHGRWFDTQLATADVRVENASDALGGFALFGPRARELLAALSHEDVSSAALPFMRVRRMTIGLAPAIVARLSVTGELGYEIYVPARHMLSVYRAIEAARARVAGRWAGYYALNSLRLEKGFGIWSREFSRDYTPRMAALTRFIAYDKPEFIGRTAAIEDRGRTPAHELVLLAIDAADADAVGGEPILLDREYVGFTTSGGYGHCVEQSLAMGYVTPEARAANVPLSVTVVGEPRAARILSQAPLDPHGLRMRG
jgi:dimethylglycine dehydrogenase